MSILTFCTFNLSPLRWVVIRFAHLDQNEAMSNDNEEQYYIKVEVEVEGSDPGGFDGPEGGEAGEPEELATSFEDDMSLSGESTDDASSRPSSPPSPVASQQPSQPPHNSIFMSSAPTLSHLDMARPPHEDPELQRKEFSSSPINIPPFRHTQQKKLQTKIHLSPKHRSRGRSESRKCRKVVNPLIKFDQRIPIKVMIISFYLDEFLFRHPLCLTK